MIKKMMVIPAVLALSVSFSQVTFAHDMEKMKEQGHHHMCMQGMMKKLDLRADQKAKIVAIRMHERKSMEGKWREVHDLTHQMRAHVESDKMDDAKLTALVHKRKDLMAEIFKAKMVSKYEIYNVLDAKQKAAYTQMATHCEEMRMSH